MAFLATVLVVLGSCGLLWLDRSSTKLSKAAWVPFFWLLIASSRPVSEWWSSPNGMSRGASYLEGSPFDRNLLTFLIVLAVLVLVRRAKQAWGILTANPAIIVFLLYCLVSVMWADYPVVSFKRWVRGVADIMMVIIVLTEFERERAFQALIGRIAYVLIPVSVLFIRFYPELGRSYSAGGVPSWTGVATDKNALGALCMLCGVVVLWRLMAILSSPPTRQRTRQLLASTTVLAMVLYLLLIIDSKTALVCFALGTVPVVLRRPFRSPAFIFFYVTTSVIACYLVVSFGMGGEALEALGREASLTGRTYVWRAVLTFVTNPWFGAGYENFWIGERQMILTRLGGNQAHNGYLEIYLNLGWVGIVLLTANILVGFKNVVADCRSNSALTGLKVSFFVICLAYNFTEAAFKMMSPVWLTFLLATMASPKLLTSDLPSRVTAAVTRSRRIVIAPNARIRQRA